MKSLVLAATAVAAITSPALAGGPTIVADDPVPTAGPAPAPVHDWSGPYVGLGYGKTSGEMTYNNIATVFEFNSGATPSVFAGYLAHRGNLVYGGELAFSQGDDATLVGFPNENLETMVDLKGRLGWAADKALFYGVLGYSTVGYLEGVAGSQDTSGLNYGVGVDVAISDRIFIGGEYLARKTDGDTTNAGQTRDLDLNTFGVRLGLSF